MKYPLRYVPLWGIEGGTTMIRLNVFLKVEASKRAEVLALTKELTAASVKEAGCVAYDIFESATRPEVLMFCETWKDEASLEAHTKTEHYKTIGGKLGTLCEMKLEKLEY